MFNLFQNNTDDFAFLLDQMGSDVLINDNPVKALITNTNLEQIYDDRRITSLSPFNRGDIVVFKGKKYMVISEVNDKRYNKYKGIMRFLPHTITVNSSCRFYTLNCYINTSNLGVIDGRVLSIPDGEITLICSNYSIDHDLEIGARFVLNDQAWKVTGIDNYSKPGMVHLTCKVDSIDNVKDDLVNGIAGGLSCPVDVTSNDFDLTVGGTYQLTWTSANNAPVRFVSSDESIASVDGLGVVTGVSAGIVTITAYNAGFEKIYDSIGVTVTNAQPNFMISITSQSSTPGEVNKGYTKTYDAVVTLGSAVITTEPVQWQLFADDQASSTALATIQSQTGVSCTIKGINTGYVQLKVSLISDPAVLAWLRIRVKSLL
ncbi:Ig-like domain-containing protein [Paenibacillus sp. DYY-L-2]|uniref:Ig-like domain-containing protein n=1 Tax=Paenibacillus sp. DYY-L-2 TaxID=3447013 RepID=UPI003F50602F